MNDVVQFVGPEKEVHRLKFFLIKVRRFACEDYRRSRLFPIRELCWNALKEKRSRVLQIIRMNSRLRKGCS